MSPRCELHGRHTRSVTREPPIASGKTCSAVPGRSSRQMMQRIAPAHSGHAARLHSCASIRTRAATATMLVEVDALIRSDDPRRTARCRPFWRIASGQKQTITCAGQLASVRHNPLLSGDFQPLTLGRMLGSSRVAEYTVGSSMSYVEGDNPSVAPVPKKCAYLGSLASTAGRYGPTELQFTTVGASKRSRTLRW